MFRIQKALSVGVLRVCVVGLIHLTSIVYGMWYLTNDEINLEQNEQHQEEEKFYAILLYSVHLSFIASLFVSAYKRSLSMLLPWLTISAGLFSYLTLMVVDGLRNMKSYLILELFVNFGCVGVCWFIWSMVFRTFKTGYTAKTTQLLRVLVLWNN